MTKNAHSYIFRGSAFNLKDKYEIQKKNIYFQIVELKGLNCTEELGTLQTFIQRSTDFITFVGIFRI